MFAAKRDSVRALHEPGLDFLTHGNLPVKAVSDTADADQISRRGRIVFYLLAERHNVVVHHAVGDVYTGAPHLFEEALAREPPSPAADESGQELQLGVGGFQPLALAAQLETRQVQLAAAKAMHFAARLGHATAEHGSEARPPR